MGCIKSSVMNKQGEMILPLCSCETPLEVLNPALGPSTQERPVKTGLENGHKDDQSAEAPLLWREAETVGVVQ